MKAEILQGVNGYCRRVANRFGLTMTQVWGVARKLKAGAYD
jgi:phytoene/squalene synthetase